MSTIIPITKVIQGDDFLESIIVLDTTSTPIPLSNMVDYNAYIYTKDDTGVKTLLYIYRKTQVSGSGDFPIQTIDTNTQGILLSRAQTSTLADKTKLYIQSAILIPSASFYETGEQKNSQEAILCEIISSPYPSTWI